MCADPDRILTDIFAIHENRASIEQLVYQVHTNGVIPFVGAGLSMGVGYPGWAGFLQKLADEAEPSIDVRAQLEKGEFEDVALQIKGNIGGDDTFQRKIAAAFGMKTFRNPENPAVQNVLALTFGQGPVVTTNFDYVLEKNADSLGYCIKTRLGIQPDFTRNAITQNQCELIKLHGDAEDRTGRVFTWTEFEKAYRGPDGYLRQVLENLFGAKSLLFVGCSLRKEDRLLARLTRSVADWFRWGHPTLCYCPASR